MSGGDPTGPPSAAPGRVGFGVAIVLATLTVLRLAFLATGAIDLSPDEAHYWEWSRRLDLAYYSKGPLIAYLIAGLTALLGTSAFAIRIGAVLLSLVGAWATYRLGRDAFGDPRPAALAVVSLQLTPLFWAGSLLLTIDVPFLVAWTLALGLLWRALERGRTVDWLAVGVLVGVGVLAKYTMLFFLPGIAVYLWRTPDARRAAPPHRLALAAVAAVVIASPIVIWNARLGWVSARHVMSQGRGPGPSALYLPEFLASQAGVLTPLVFLALAWGLVVAVREGLGRGREPYRFLAAFAAPVILSYLLVALQGKVQANWAAAAYPPLALATAGLLVERQARLDGVGRKRQRRFVLAAGIVALVVSLGGHATTELGLPPRLDPTTRLRGWQDLARATEALVNGMPDPARTFLVSDRYQVTSELAFYVRGHPPAYNLNLGRRLNQYDFWEGPETKVGWDAVYVKEGARALDERVAAAFDRIDPPVVFEVRRGERVLRTFTLYRGYGFRGVVKPNGPPRF